MRVKKKKWQKKPKNLNTWKVFYTKCNKEIQSCNGIAKYAFYNLIKVIVKWNFLLETNKRMLNYYVISFPHYDTEQSKIGSGFN